MNIHTHTNTHTDVECSDTVLPVTYDRFTDMVEAGDSVYMGRYLVSGSDSASLYLKVCVCVGGCVWVCGCVCVCGVGGGCMLRVR